MEGIIRTFQVAMQNVWAQLVANLPQIVGALVVLFFGTLLAATLGLLAARLVKSMKLDQIVNQLKVGQLLAQIGISDFKLSRLVGWLVKWFFVVVVFISAADILGWKQLTVFLTNVALYLPKIVVAVFIVLAGTALANFVGLVIRKGVAASKIGHPGVIGAFARWVIIVFTVMAALVQLDIAKELTQILFTGLVGMLSIAGGLAFGLGGKDMAKDWLDQLRRETD